jgi:hypothetical protein
VSRATLVRFVPLERKAQCLGSLLAAVKWRRRGIAEPPKAAARNVEKKPDEGAQASVTNKHFASVDYRNISQDLCAAIFQSRISKIFPLARRAAFCVLFAGRETIFAAAATRRDSHLIISGRIYFRRRGSHPLNGSGLRVGK